MCGQTDESARDSVLYWECKAAFEPAFWDRQGAPLSAGASADGAGLEWSHNVSHCVPHSIVRPYLSTLSP